MTNRYSGAAYRWMKRGSGKPACRAVSYSVAGMSSSSVSAASRLASSPDADCAARCTLGPSGGGSTRSGHSKGPPRRRSRNRVATRPIGPRRRTISQRASRAKGAAAANGRQSAVKHSHPLQARNASMRRSMISASSRPGSGTACCREDDAGAGSIQTSSSTATVTAITTRRRHGMRRAGRLPSAGRSTGRLSGSSAVLTTAAGWKYRSKAR